MKRFHVVLAISKLSPAIRTMLYTIYGDSKTDYDQYRDRVQPCQLLVRYSSRGMSIASEQKSVGPTASRATTARRSQFFISLRFFDMV